MLQVFINERLLRCTLNVFINEYIQIKHNFLKINLQSLIACTESYQPITFSNHYQPEVGESLEH